MHPFRAFGPFLGFESWCGSLPVVLGGAHLSSIEGQILFFQACSIILALERNGQ